MFVFAETVVCFS